MSNEAPSAGRRSFSLLYPHPIGSPASPAIPPTAARDLGIDIIAAGIARTGISRTQVEGILRDLPTDVGTITHRQEILRDFLDSEALRQGFDKLIPNIHEILFFSSSRRESDSVFLQAIWRLGELDLFVQCVGRTAEILTAAGTQIRSRGLLHLRSQIEELKKSEIFLRMEQEIPKVRAGLQLRRSVTIGVNLDNRLRPTEATLLSINERRYEEESLFGKLFGPSKDRREFRTFTPIHSTPGMGGPPGLHGRTIPLAPLFDDIEQLLRPLSRPIVETVKSYVKVETSFLMTLASEAAFYLGAATMIGDLRKQGVPFCIPTILPAEQRETDLKGLVNLQLALRLSSDEESQAGLDIVPNDARLDELGRIAVLTALPMACGKTTFTQAIGIAQALTQAGLYAPAVEARVSPADRILTHFPVGEEGQIATGRLAEEADRFAEIFAAITTGSLLLMNESLSSTSPGESLYLAEDILRALCSLGVRCVFATHLHELGESVATLSDGSPGSSVAYSLVAGIDHGSGDGGKRTYKIVRGPPMGKSFASDIAEQCGISYHQIRDLFRKRGLIE